MLFRNLRVHQIFGANTEVGKTVFATALARASSEAGEASHYLKPVGTGGYGDDWHVRRFAPRTTTECLHYFDEPVSPHLAAQRAKSKNEKHQIPTDAQVSSGIAKFAEKVAKGLLPTELASLLVETAGGVHSPTLSGSSQANAYRSLRLPTVLVASPHLGGISTTISAYESLLMRGYDIDALLCFHETYYENWRYFERWCEEKGITMGVLRPPPADATANGSGREDDIANMEKFYRSLESGTSAETDIPPYMSLQQVVRQLQTRHQQRLEQLDTAAQRSRDCAWWPFAQHSHIKSDKDVMVIESAYGDVFSVYGEDRNAGTTTTTTAKGDVHESDTSANQLKPLFDGSASWWTQCLGHANPELTLATAQAAGRYGHVIYAQSTHLPALELSETLLKTVGKGWADRVFFSDNGSTGMEVALKMALRSSAVRLAEHDALKPGARAELGVLGLKGSYHGDTIGAMDASEGGVYNSAVEWYRGRGFWLDVPLVRFESGIPTIRLDGPHWQFEDGSGTATFHHPHMASLYDVEARLEKDHSLIKAYTMYIERSLAKAQKAGIQFGALVLEPVVMGAGGQLFVDPLFQRLLVDIAREKLSLPVVFDEVYVGLYRLGQMTGASVLGVKPDVSCHAKILTGGLLPLAVTLASKKIFECFLAPEKKDALLHGHSYTAHPIGCSVANKSLEIIQRLDARNPDWQQAKQAWRSTDAAVAGDDSTPQAVDRNGKMENPFFSLWSLDFVERVSKLDNIDAAMTMGTVLVLHLKDTQNAGYQSTASASFLRHLRHPKPGSDNLPIHARPLGNTVYWMTSLNTPADTIRNLETSIWEALHRAD